MQVPTLERSAPGALCQPPPAGVRCSQLDQLLDEVLAVKPPVIPPVELVDRMIAAKRQIVRIAAHSQRLAEMAGDTLLIEITHIMAAATPGHDPFDTDEMLRLDAEQLDEIAALGMALRIDRNAGRMLDDATALYIDTEDDRWRGVHYDHAVTAATSLLQTVLRRREGGAT